MKEVVLRNNSQTPVEIPLCEKEPVVVVKAHKRCQLNPGEEIILGSDIPADRVRHYEQFGAIDVELEYREATEEPEYVEITGVKPIDNVKASIIKYSGRNYVSVKYEKATLKKVTAPTGYTGYLIGIVVVAPEGAAFLVRSNKTAQNDLDEMKAAVPASQFDKKIFDGKDGWFFYIEAGAEVPAQWIRTRWLAEDGSVIEENDYYLDLTNITLE